MSCSVNQLDELADVDRFDGAMRRNGQRSSVLANEYAMAAFLMPPVNAMLSRYRLQICDLPIPRIAPHCGDQLGRSVHGRDTTRETGVMLRLAAICAA